MLAPRPIFICLLFAWAVALKWDAKEDVRAKLMTRARDAVSGLVRNVPLEELAKESNSFVKDEDKRAKSALQTAGLLRSLVGALTTRNPGSAVSDEHASWLLTQVASSTSSLGGSTAPSGADREELSIAEGLHEDQIILTTKALVSRLSRGASDSSSEKFFGEAHRVVRAASHLRRVVRIATTIGDAMRDCTGLDHVAPVSLIKELTERVDVAFDAIGVPSGDATGKSTLFPKGDIESLQRVRERMVMIVNAVAEVAEKARQFCLLREAKFTQDKRKHNDAAPPPKPGALLATWKGFVDESVTSVLEDGARGVVKALVYALTKVKA